MAKFLHANLETNEENDDGVAVTLYFDGEPTDDEVKAACRDQRGKLELSVNPEDEYFGWQVYPGNSALKEGVVRVQAFPCC